MKSREKAEKALLAFVQTINDTGGVKQGSDGLPVPVGDETWDDLGTAYMLACEALGFEPEWAPEENILDRMVAETTVDFSSGHPVRNGVELCDCPKGRNVPDCVEATGG